MPFRSLKRAAGNAEPGTWNLEPGTGNQEQGTGSAAACCSPRRCLSPLLEDGQNRE